MTDAAGTRGERLFSFISPRRGSERPLCHTRSRKRSFGDGVAPHMIPHMPPVRPNEVLWGHLVDPGDTGATPLISSRRNIILSFQLRVGCSANGRLPISVLAAPPPRILLHMGSTH